MEYTIVSNVAERMSLFIEDDMTVGEVRAIVGAMLDAPENIEIVMTYNGKLLKVDGDRWCDAAPRGGASAAAAAPRKLYCNVTGKVKLEGSSSEAIRAVIPGKEVSLAEERMERARARAMEPMIEQMANNPELMSAMMASQPGLKKLMDSNPDVARQMKDPETLKMIMMSQLDPDRRKEMGRNMELALSQVSNYPGGQQMLERYLTGFLRDQEGTAERTEDDLHATDEDLARPDPSKARNSSALPNPWQQQHQQQQQQMGFGGGGASPFQGMFGGAATSQPHGAPVGAQAGSPFNTSPEMMQRMMQMMAAMGGSGGAGEEQLPAHSVEARDFSQQLGALRAMGFENEVLCREALEACDGDVEAAVDYLAEKME